MENRARTFFKPVLILLLIGSIVGLIFLYYDMENKGNINAENEQNMEEEHVEDNDENKEDSKPQEVPPIKEEEVIVLPRYAVDGVLKIGDENTDIKRVHRYLGGYMMAVESSAKEGDFKIGDKKGVGIAYVEKDRLLMLDTISESEDITYVDSCVGRYGLVVVAKSNERCYIYRYDYSLKRLPSKVIENVSDISLIPSIDNIALTYLSDGKRKVSIYGSDMNNNSILDIDNINKVKMSRYLDNGSIELVFGDGEVVNIAKDSAMTILRLNMDIVDIDKIVHEGKLAIAVIGKKDNEKRLYIYDDNYNLVRTEGVYGDKILFLDRLYVLDKTKHTIDRYCTCGEYIETVGTDIDTIYYIDRENMSYSYTDGTSYYMSKYGKNSSQITSKYRAIYMDKDIIVYIDNGIRCEMVHG